MQAFPKITGKHADFLLNLARLKQISSLTGTILLEGTVKLHGLHADIVYDLGPDSQPGQFPQFQSRNRVLAPEEDCSEWPRRLTLRPDSLSHLESLKHQILQRWSCKNPDTALDRSFPLVVAGEWIGENVQMNTALQMLSKQFVITAIRINGRWQADEDFADIECQSIGIYSIFRGRRSLVPFNLDDVSHNNPALLQMQKLADIVESSCPFAAAFGIRCGRGEGVVWKPGTPMGRADPRYWFKTKGPLSGPETRIDLVKMRLIANERQSIDDMCRTWMHARRIEQGFEFLLETNSYPSPTSLRDYQGWFTHEILTEEATPIRDLEKKIPGAARIVTQKVRDMARQAYFSKAKELKVWQPWFISFGIPANNE